MINGAISKGNKIKLFGTGFGQVFLVSVNTWLIAHELLAAVAVVGFGISILWSFNVKSVAFGGWPDRLLYSAGASIGGLIGVLTAMYLFGG